MSSVRKKAVDTTTPFVLLLLSIAGGYYAVRAQNKKKLMNVEEAEKSSIVRAQIPLAERLNQDKLRRWLQETEESDAAASSKDTNMK